MPLSFCNQTVTVLRAPFKDKRNSKVRDWNNAEAHEVANCLVTAQSTSQDRDGRELQVTAGRTLRAMYDADVQPGDRVVVDGVTYEVDGDVFHSASPTGRVSSTRCSLTRWEG